MGLGLGQKRFGSGWRGLGYHFALGSDCVHIVPVEHAPARATAPAKVLAQRHIIQARRGARGDGDIHSLRGSGASPEQSWIRVGSHHFTDGGRCGNRGLRLDGRDDEFDRLLVLRGLRPLHLSLPGDSGPDTARQYRREYSQCTHLDHLFPPSHPATERWALRSIAPVPLMA